MDKFADIRPYNDDETRPAINQIIDDDEFINSILSLKFPTLPVWVKIVLTRMVRWVMRRQVKDVKTVWDFQMKVEHYCKHMIDKTMDGFSVSGLENLDLSQAYIYVSNHRDIAMDPALINYALHTHGSQTVRIAIGDNLLTKEFVTNLMRINKSFIVKRSTKGPRELLKILNHLSAYISYSIKVDKHPVWIAQREGRAKDGFDKTDAAIIKMMALDGRKLGFEESIKALKIVPVSVSYEYDPCDQLKANELHAVEAQGNYVKGDQEDVHSIAKGISGYKGHVHIHFGEVLTNDFNDADAVAEHIDSKVVGNYVLQPNNYFAYYQVYNEYPQGVYGTSYKSFDAKSLQSEKLKFEQHMAEIDEPLKPFVLNAYANPIVNKLNLGLM